MVIWVESREKQCGSGLTRVDSESACFALRKLARAINREHFQQNGASCLLQVGRVDDLLTS